MEVDEVGSRRIGMTPLFTVEVALFCNMYKGAQKI